MENGVERTDTPILKEDVETDTPILIEDTRNKADKHLNIQRYCKKAGIGIVRRALKAGDYMTEGGTVTVDTKQGLGEVYGNLVQDHARFRRECIRAREMGLTLVVLVEESGIRSVEDVRNWKNPRQEVWEKAKAGTLQPWRRAAYIRACAPPISSTRLMRIMQTMAENYGVRWEFCDKRHTGERVCRILGIKTGSETTGRSSGDR